MCTLITKTFRPAQRDLEVVYRDAFGVEKRLYVGLATVVPVDVNKIIADHFAMEDAICAAIKRAQEG